MVKTISTYSLMLTSGLRKIKSKMTYIFSSLILGRNHGPHLTRFCMYRQLSNIRVAKGAQSIKVLSISNSCHLASVIGLAGEEILNACYPECDILALPFKDDSFDVVVSDQVLEHIKGNPQVAIDETRRVLRKGGVAVHTTCFMNPIHEHPIDMWRFTPSCLEYLFRDWSQIIDCGGWGNRLAFVCMNIGLRMAPVPHARWHPLHKIATANNKQFPIVTWIAAIK
jgi:SAM-dependent methyltransferase